MIQEGGGPARIGKAHLSKEASNGSTNQDREPDVATRHGGEKMELEVGDEIFQMKLRERQLEDKESDFKRRAKELEINMASDILPPEVTEVFEF